MATPTESATSSTESPLERRLGYRFADARLLVQALRHRSLGEAHNERLEFLGDSVLGLVVSDDLYRRFPDASEGELTTMRAALVCRDTLAGIARDLGLEEHIVFGEGARAAGIRSDSLLADTLESVCGAVWLDGGFDAARDMIGRLFAEPLARAAPDDLKDPKTRLQERLQRDGLTPPEYRVTAREGPDHRPRFQVECWLAELDRSVRADGPNRRAAEQAAAARMLAELGDD